MSKLFFLYLIIPVLMLVLFFQSKDLVLPERIEDTGISRAYLKISLYIYRYLKERPFSFSREKIRTYLGTLEHRKDIDGVETEYFIRKISIVLLMATAGSFLSLMLCISSGQDGKITDSGTLERSDFGGKGYDVDLVASDEAGNELGQYHLSVENRIFTDEEAQRLFEQASVELEKVVIGENESFDVVTKDLDLVESLEGYPFDIRWKLDNYEVMHFDGRLIDENIPKEGVVVELVAWYSYKDLRWQQVFHANIMPRVLNPVERTYAEIEKLLKGADEASVEEREINLPKTYGNRQIIWSQKMQDNSLLLLLLTLIGGAASYVLKDKELKKTMEERQQELLSDYPQFVSKLVLYMGAGMTVRNVFNKLAVSYVKKRDNGAGKRYLYEEILRVNRELATGASESETYERFGARCMTKQYTRLATLLSQNIRKGNGELLALLSEEAQKAFEERMDKVKKTGEEAGTRLLLPMIIMLVIVMAMIMVPAYMAF
ncbi:MAG: type II secretion system F family protein [Butyrivibrio sp.]|nr:type II secretion system F family protein [Butyrivibrio sp.]